VVNPQDFLMALNILGQTLLETITRVGKRQTEVLELAERSNPLNKHRVSAELNVSDSTAYKCLKSLAELGFLKEDRTAKPFDYELVKKRSKELGILKNPSQYCLYFQNRLTTLLNRISPTLREGVAQKNVEMNGLEYVKNEKIMDTSLWRVEEVPSELKNTGKEENKLFPFGFSETPRQFKSLSELAGLTKELTRLLIHTDGKCAFCQKEGRMDWQITLHDETWGLLCEDCGLKLSKEIGKVG